jgi:antirestriction protein ArdC
MSKQFKPLHEQIADKLIAEFKAGTSPFQKPVKDNGMPAFVTPVNPITGKGYSALNAINLALKGFDDPRWMSSNTASFNKYRVITGSKATLINFPKKNEIQAIRNPDGEKIKDEAGVTKTKTIEFDKIQNGKAFLFNAEQIRDIPPLEEWLQETQDETLSPNERAEKMIRESGATIIHGGEEAFYDKIEDVIYLPEKEAFENDTKYYQTAIHQLAHWTGHESRLNRPMEGRFGSMDYAKEELRAAIGAMLVGGELKIGNHFGPHAAYTPAWSKLLKDDPFEISRASSDAQKIANVLLGKGPKQELEQSASEEQHFSQDNGNPSNDGIDDEPGPQLKKDSPVSQTISKGEEIPYNNTTYKVLDKKGKTFEMEKEDTGERFKIKATDQVFLNLVEARNNPQKEELEVAVEQEQTQRIGR